MSRPAGFVVTGVVSLGVPCDPGVPSGCRVHGSSPGLVSNGTDPIGAIGWKWGYVKFQRVHQPGSDGPGCPGKWCSAIPGSIPKRSICGTLLLGFAAFGRTLDSIISEDFSSLCDSVKSNCVPQKRGGIQCDRKGIREDHI